MSTTETADSTTVKSRTISAGAKEKCIQQARKSVQSQKKWGYWSAIFNFGAGLTFLVLGICFVVLLQWFVLSFVNGLGNQGQAIQNGAETGFILGLIFGFIAMAAIFKGIFYITEGVKSLRGDPASHIIVEYHDALVALMHDPTCCDPPALPDTDQT